jgi:hypothetical protein
MRPGTPGWKWDEATKEKISKTCLKRNFNKEYTEKRINASIEMWGRKVKCIETGKEFISESEAAREYDLNPSQVSSVCLGKRHTTHGLSFRFID